MFTEKHFTYCYCKFEHVQTNINCTFSILLIYFSYNPTVTMTFVQISVCVITIVATTAAQIITQSRNTTNVSTNGLLGPNPIINVSNNLVITSNISVSTELFMNL